MVGGCTIYLYPDGLSVLHYRRHRAELTLTICNQGIATFMLPVEVFETGIKIWHQVINIGSRFKVTCPAKIDATQKQSPGQKLSKVVPLTNFGW